MSKLMKGRDQRILITITLLIVVIIGILFLYLAFGDVALAHIIFFGGLVLFCICLAGFLKLLMLLTVNELELKQAIIYSALTILTSTTCFGLIYLFFYIRAVHLQ